MTQTEHFLIPESYVDYYIYDTTKEEMLSYMTQEINQYVKIDIDKEHDVESFIANIRRLENTLYHKYGYRVIFDIESMVLESNELSLFGLKNIIIDVIMDGLIIAKITIYLDTRLLDNVWYFFYYNGMSATCFILNYLLGQNTSFDKISVPADMPLYTLLADSDANPDTYKVVIQSNMIQSDNMDDFIEHMYRSNYDITLNDDSLIIEPANLDIPVVEFVKDMKLLLRRLVFRMNDHNKEILKQHMDVDSDKSIVSIHAHVTMKHHNNGILFYTDLSDRLSDIIRSKGIEKEQLHESLWYFVIKPEFEYYYPF